MNNKRELRLSQKFLRVEYIEDVKNYKIENKTIVLNIGAREIEIEGEALRPFTSSIYANTVIKEASKIIIISLNEELFSKAEFPFAKDIMTKWQHVHDIFPLPHLKETRLWRSEKDRVGDIEFNFWFATAGADCGIHNVHDFKEIHTQVVGIGSMQKFHENDKRTIYQEVILAPGSTHEPFYNENSIYPWHQYFAYSDCIWMAIEVFEQ